MTDIVQRLRETAEHDSAVYGQLFCDAADEIERLRRQIRLSANGVTETVEWIDADTKQPLTRAPALTAEEAERLLTGDGRLPGSPYRIDGREMHCEGRTIRYRYFVSASAGGS